MAVTGQELMAARGQFSVALDTGLERFDQDKGRTVPIDAVEFLRRYETQALIEPTRYGVRGSGQVPISYRDGTEGLGLRLLAIP